MKTKHYQKGGAISPRKELAMGRTPAGLPVTPSKPKFNEGGAVKPTDAGYQNYGKGIRRAPRGG